MVLQVVVVGIVVDEVVSKEVSNTYVVHDLDYCISRNWTFLSTG